MLHAGRWVVVCLWDGFNVCEILFGTRVLNWIVLILLLFWIGIYFVFFHAFNRLVSVETFFEQQSSPYDSDTIIYLTSSNGAFVRATQIDGAY